MNQKKFAEILVRELVDKNQQNVMDFYKRIGFSGDFYNKDEIWKLFVVYNLFRGMRNSVVERKVSEDQYFAKSNRYLFLNRQRLINALKSLEGSPCYLNFTTKCKVKFKKAAGFTKDACYNQDKFKDCPVIRITQEISWHRQHYKISKIICECAKRLFIEDKIGKKTGDINQIVQNLIAKHGSKEGTQAFILKFKNISGYGGAYPKIITWWLSDLSSPCHHICHFKDIDLSVLVPIDTHVKRLTKRFKFVSPHADNEEIQEAIRRLYPQEPRKLNFALFRLGAENEENICTSEPNCAKCREKFPEIFKHCLVKKEE